MRIFISSVRVGLEDERDALPSLIRALGHEPVRFEDFTAQAVPSREACLNGVRSSDVYLLLLGPNYGEPFPDTGQSPTHDEWMEATRIGMPRYVFRKDNVEFEVRQKEFEASLGEYRTGRFWAGFSSATDLLSSVAEVVRDLETAPSALTFEPLPRPVTVDWSETNSGNTIQGRPELEVHVVPIDGAPLSERILEQLADGLPLQVRAATLVSATEALSVNQTFGQVELTVPVRATRGWNEAIDGYLSAVRVRSNGQIAVRFHLPGDTMGTIFDPQDIAARIAAALRLVGQLQAASVSKIAVGIGLTSTSMLTIGTAGGPPRSSASMSSGQGGLRVEPDEAVSVAAFDRGAGEVAATLSRSLARALRG